MTKFILGIIAIVLIAIFLIDYISLTTEKPKQKGNKLNVSEISKNCDLTLYHINGERYNLILQTILKIVVNHMIS